MHSEAFLAYVRARYKGKQKNMPYAAYPYNKAVSAKCKQGLYRQIPSHLPILLVDGKAKSDYKKRSQA